MQNSEKTYDYLGHEITICKTRGLYYWITDGDTDEENMSSSGFETEKQAKDNAQEFIDEVIALG